MNVADDEEVEEEDDDEEDDEEEEEEEEEEDEEEFPNAVCPTELSLFLKENDKLDTWFTLVRSTWPL